MAALDPSAQLGVQRLIDALPDPLLLLDAQGRIVRVNEAFAHRAHQTQEQLRGRAVQEVFEHARDTALQIAFREVRRSGRPQQVEFEVPGEGRWLDVRIFNVDDEIGVEYREITELKREQVRNLELGVRHATLQAETQALHAFAQFTESAGHTSDPDALARQAVEVLHAALRSGDAAYLILREGHWQAQVWAGDLSETMQQVLQAGLPAETPIAVQAAQLTLPLYVEHWREQDDPIARLVSEYAAVAITPVRANGELQGLLVAGQAHEPEWGTRERAITQAVWRSMNLAAERAVIAARLESKREQLEAANSELENFAHAVAHDLRAPVRHVTSFTTFLQRALGEGDVSKAARYADSVKRAAGRMDELIASLLEFSRTATLPLFAQNVELNALVADVRAELLEDAPDRVVTWQVGELPIVRGDARLLRQVLLNLLGNALKYTGQQAVAVIELTAEEDALEYVVHVRDNGAGFDQRYAERLFGVFQRLHHEREFEGIGVGLATVQRIVHRHGGRVWAQGAVGVGATFSFSLPK